VPQVDELAAANSELEDTNTVLEAKAAQLEQQLQTTQQELEAIQAQVGQVFCSQKIDTYCAILHVALQTFAFGDSVQRTRSSEWLGEGRISYVIYCT
jgi:hypothetical protein